MDKQTTGTVIAAAKTVVDEGKQKAHENARTGWC